MNKPLTEILGVKVSAVNSTHQFKVGEMHGISSGLFLIQSLLGLWMVWRLTRHPTNP